MAVRQGNSREVPKDQQESPFLVIHVPGMNQLKVCPPSAYPPYHVVVMHSSPLAQALAYKKCAITRNMISPVT